MCTEWVKVHSTATLYKAGIITSLLEEHEIKTFIINKKDSMHTHLSNGEIEIFVEQTTVLKANYILSKHKL